MGLVGSAKKLKIHKQEQQLNTQDILYCNELVPIYNKSLISTT